MNIYEKIKEKGIEMKLEPLRVTTPNFVWVKGFESPAA